MNLWTGYFYYPWKLSGKKKITLFSIFICIQYIPVEWEKYSSKADSSLEIAAFNALYVLMTPD